MLAPVADHLKAATSHPELRPTCSGFARSFTAWSSLTSTLRIRWWSLSMVNVHRTVARLVVFPSDPEMSTLLASSSPK
eukprot:10391578-Alexandrium_andersonii.AAC.1